MNEISVVIPCYNESGNIHELTSRLEASLEKICSNYEIIYVNDASIDSTESEILENCSRNNRIRLITLNKNAGMANAWKVGVSHANSNYCTLIDADLQYQPEDIVRLYEEIKFKNSDIVQGYRSSVGRLRGSRFILSKTLNIILNLMFSMNLKDNKSGFIITKTQTLKDILISRFRYRHFQTFLLVSANSKKYSISEIEVLFSDRLVGKSFITKLPIKLIFEVLIDFVLALYEFRVSDRESSTLTYYVNKFKTNKAAPDRSLLKKIRLFIYFYTMPLHAWVISKNVRTYYNELSNSQWFSREQIEELQLEKLRKLVTHSYYHVRYYRNLFDSLGIKPDDIQSLDDLSKLPYLTKSIITDNLHYGMLSDNHDKSKILKIVTSGSTGIPFTCYADKFQLEMRWAATLRSMEWTGYVFGDKCARLWHQTIGMRPIQVIKEFIDAKMSNRIFLPAYSMNSANIMKYMKKLQRFNPVLIDGYAESFNFLANFLRENESFKLNPKAVISSAQILPDQSREAIESRFQTKAYDKYGSREFSGIAYEAGTKNEHLIVAENYIVEIIVNDSKAKPGEMGEVVITDLNNYCMPFLRYKIGDLAVAMDPNQRSSCGRGLPMLGKIEGRVQAIIFGEGNRFLPGTFFAHFFKEYPHLINQYQVIQNELGSIELKIIKGKRFTDASMNDLLQELRKHLGERTCINLEYVNIIEMVRTGKHQGAISNLKIDFQSLN
jgi:phenylacetate-CoA ligase